LGWPELKAVLSFPKGNAVEQFEVAFAETMRARYALAFPRGRSGLWAFFRALDIENAEIIMPAYTCVVVAHAIVLSGNIPRFVDIDLCDYDMDLDQVQAAINERTRAIVPAHLFGFPLNVDRLDEIVRDAEARYGHKIWIIQDCAHSFGARWRGKLVCNEGDCALFGLNISKMMTSIFGGMMTTNDSALAKRLREWRDAHFVCPGVIKSWRRRLYLLAVYPAFNERLYGLVHWLQEETPLLDRLTKAYHLDGRIHFPPDYLDQMLDVEAQVGLSQLRKYPEIVRRRQENARYYNDHLQGVPGFVLPPIVDGATYSHYVLRVADRTSVLKALQRKGVQLGQLIEYSVPHMTAYCRHADGEDFPHSWLCSQHTINLPVHAHLQASQRQQIVEHLVLFSERMAKRGTRPIIDHIRPIETQGSTDLLR
jgi:dTDP-4-amino-4,6-dideoxygalactose transaminase